MLRSRCSMISDHKIICRGKTAFGSIVFAIFSYRSCAKIKEKYKVHYPLTSSVLPGFFCDLSQLPKRSLYSLINQLLAFVWCGLNLFLIRASIKKKRFIVNEWKSKYIMQRWKVTPQVQNEKGLTNFRASRQLRPPKIQRWITPPRKALTSSSHYERKRKRKNPKLRYFER